MSSLYYGWNAAVSVHMERQSSSCYRHWSLPFS